MKQMLFISLVALSKSFEAPVVISSFPKNTSSAALHPSKVTASSRNFAFDWRYLSSSGIIHVTHSACPRDTIDIFSTGSACSST